MAWEDWPMVEKTNRNLVLKHEPDSQLAICDFAEQAGQIGQVCYSRSLQSCLRPSGVLADREGDSRNWALAYARAIAPFIGYLMVSKAFRVVIINHSDGLHKRVTNRRSNELETAT